MNIKLYNIEWLKVKTVIVYIKITHNIGMYTKNNVYIHTPLCTYNE